MMDQMSATGRGSIRQTHDFYATPAWAVHAIADHLGPHRYTLDPAAGSGHILAALRDHDPRRFGVLRGFEIQTDIPVVTDNIPMTIRDALGPESWGNVDLVTMNPPYMMAMEFVQRAIHEVGRTAGTVAALLRLNWLGSKKRAEFHRQNPADVYVLSKRPSFIYSDKSGSSTDATEYAWFVWGPFRGNRWFIL